MLDRGPSLGRQDAALPRAPASTDRRCGWPPGGCRPSRPGAADLRPGTPKRRGQDGRRRRIASARRPATPGATRPASDPAAAVAATPLRRWRHAASGRVPPRGRARATENHVRKMGHGGLADAAQRQGFSPSSARGLPDTRPASRRRLAHDGARQGGAVGAGPGGAESRAASDGRRAAAGGRLRPEMCRRHVPMARSATIMEASRAAQQAIAVRGDMARHTHVAAAGCRPFP
jgi:hypothetical protein